MNRVSSSCVKTMLWLGFQCPTLPSIAWLQKLVLHLLPMLILECPITTWHIYLKQWLGDGLHAHGMSNPPISLPSQWTFNGASDENSDLILVDLVAWLLALAWCIAFWLMFNIFTSCPRLDATSQRTNIAFLDEILALSKDDESPGDIMSILALLHATDT